MMRLLILIPFSIILFSCFEQGDCSNVSSNILTVKFYNHSDKKPKTFLMDSVKLDHWDSVMYENENINSMELPLDFGSTSLVFHLFHENTQTDLAVSYDFKTFALAPGCDAIDLISITEADAVTIQEVTIIQSKLSTADAENIRMYF